MIIVIKYYFLNMILVSLSSGLAGNGIYFGQEILKISLEISLKSRLSPQYSFPTSRSWPRDSFEEHVSHTFLASSSEILPPLSLGS